MYSNFGVFMTWLKVLTICSLASNSAGDCFTGALTFWIDGDCSYSSFVPQQPLLGGLASGFNAASPCGDDPGCSFHPTIGNFDSQPGATGNGEVRPRGNSSRLGLISE